MNKVYEKIIDLCEKKNIYKNVFDNYFYGLSSVLMLRGSRLDPDLRK